MYYPSYQEYQIQTFKVGSVAQECNEVHSIFLLCHSQNFDGNSLFTPKMTMLASSIISSYYNIQAQEGTNLHLVCVDDIFMCVVGLFLF